VCVVLNLYPVVATAFRDVKPEGHHYCSAACPLNCHRSPERQLRLWIGSDNRLMFGCHGGCNKLEILRAVGLSWQDTFPAETDWKRQEVRQEVAARYPYRDEAGRLLYETVRLEPGRGGRDKDFRQRRPLVPSPRKREHWAWNLDGVRRVLYRLPELLLPARAGEPVAVVGGEKDADSLAAVGLIGTTNVGGERSPWLDEYSEALAGRHVVVIEDRDAAGRRHASEVCGSLMDHAASVRRVRLPAKDATAFLNGLRSRGVTAADDLRDDLLAVLDESRLWVGVG
jgi:hypothetical protein